MKKSVREWVKKAETDFRGAGALAGASEPFHDQVCFFSQQAVEKYLKALLDELGLTIPKTHDLDHLLNLLTPHHPDLRSHRRGLDSLTEAAVAMRYPGDSATKRQAASALRRATDVRAACRIILGLREPRRRRPN